MDTRKTNDDLPIVFGTKCDSAKAEEKLKGKPAGTFLIRESSVPGLITFSTMIQGTCTNCRIGLEGNAEGLHWVFVPGGKDPATAAEFAKKAANAFKHLRDNPESFKSLIELLKQRGFKEDKILMPATREEASNNYNYRASAYTQNAASPVMEHKGYGKE